MSTPLIVAAAAWWILVTVYPRTIQDTQRVEARGPYPSADLCRVAGRAMFPDDHRFWTPEEVRAATERARLLAAQRAADLARLRRPGTAQTLTLSDGTTLTYTAQDEVVRQWSPLRPRAVDVAALSDCARVEE